MSPRGSKFQKRSAPKMDADLRLRGGDGREVSEPTARCVLVGTIYRYPAYNMNRADFDEVRARRGKVGTMCFRPSPVSNGCDDGNTICCQTCGMPVSIDMSNCPYCGDPIPSDLPDGFDIDDPSYNTRII